MKKIIKLTLIAALITVLLCACSSQPASTVTQSDLGPEPENITEETILGRWYFKGIETEYIDFYDDGTYETNNDGKEGGGTYTLSEDCKTIHLKDPLDINGQQKGAEGTVSEVRLAILKSNTEFRRVLWHRNIYYLKKTRVLYVVEFLFGLVWFGFWVLGGIF